MVGINQSMEVIAALKVVIEQGKSIMADGKFGLDDIKKIAPAFEALKLAKEGSGEIPLEMKDLDGEEIGELIMASAEVIMLAYEALLGAAK